MTESDIMHSIMITISGRGHLIFRANVGKVLTADGRWFSTGLPKGFPDLFGVRKDGKAFFIEVKTQSGNLRPEQKKFLAAMEKRKIISGVARSSEDAVNIVEGEQ